MKHARVFGDRQVRAERQLLEDAAQAERLGARRRVGPLVLAGNDQPPAIGRNAPVQHMHQRRLAGAVMADDADAFAPNNGEVDAVQGPDGAVGFLDAGEIDERGARARHGSSLRSAREPSQA